MKEEMMNNEFMWQFYAVKCNSKYFVRFDVNKDGNVIPMLTEMLENETAKLFSLFSEAKEICNICSNHRHVKSPNSTSDYDCWSIVAVNRESHDCNSGKCLSCYETLREVGTIWSIDI